MYNLPIDKDAINTLTIQWLKENYRALQLNLESIEAMDSSVERNTALEDNAMMLMMIMKVIRHLGGDANE